jgi:hypothetical protein
VPDRGGEGEEAGVDPGQGPAAAGFEGELAPERVDDGLDPLALPGELAEPGGLVFAVGSAARSGR